MTDVSTSVMGAVLSKASRTPGNLSPSSPKKLNPAHQKYSAYDRELLAIYEGIKHFRHMLEARHFIIFTDHKPSSKSGTNAHCGSSII
jgi:cleavage and polyadenylation specificity factor subunit 1